jgi:hypothetical protein
MASEERVLPRWARAVLRFALVIVLFLIGVAVRDHDHSSQAKAGPPDRYTATFGRHAQSLVHRGVDLYYFRDAVGHVTDTAVLGNQLIVHVAIDEEAAARVHAMDPAFEIFRDRKHRGEGWIALIPKDSRGSLMNAEQAARAWGRTAS